MGADVAPVQHAASAARACLASSLGLEPAPRLDGVDHRLFADIARLNKISLQTIGQVRGQADYLDQVLVNHRMRTAALNTRALRTSALVHDALRSAGLDFLLFKGPAQQAVLYGDIFTRASGDVDVLVARRDFRRATSVLQGLGFDVASLSRSVWWSSFLGEQHFSHTQTSLSVVDLHHRIHQPGIPGPPRVDPFIERAQAVEINKFRLAVPGLADTMLIACISIAKALYNRQPCAGYVGDVQACLNKMSDQELDDCHALASREGLEGILALGMRAANAMFAGYRAGRHAAFLPSITDEQLVEMTMTPWLPTICWPERRTVLWAACMRKPVRFLAESCWAIASEIGRKTFEERGRQSTHGRGDASRQEGLQGQ